MDLQNMALFALIHGGGDVGWYWHLVEAELRSRGHDSVAPDLPCDDDSATLDVYANTVIEAIGDRRELVVVGQSYGAFTAPIVADRLTADVLVLLAGMIPSPGEAAADWWDDTGYPKRHGSRPRSMAARRAMRTRSSVTTTMFLDHWPRRRCVASAGSRRRHGSNPGRWTHGRTCRRSSCCAETTACFRPHSFDASRGSAWTSSPTRSRAATALRSAVRESWPSSSSATPLRNG